MLNKNLKSTFFRSINHLLFEYSKTTIILLIVGFAICFIPGNLSPYWCIPFFCIALFLIIMMIVAWRNRNEINFKG